MKRSTMMTLVAGTLVTLFVGAAVADAAEMRLRCEKRAGRSKIDVDGRNVPRGQYTCTVTSGSNSATHPKKSSVRGQVEFDFDSNTGEVGDLRIPANFIQNGSVCATINGPTTLNGCAKCEVR